MHPILFITCMCRVLYSNQYSHHIHYCRLLRRERIIIVVNSYNGILPDNYYSQVRGRVGVVVCKRPVVPGPKLWSSIPVLQYVEVPVQPVKHTGYPLLSQL